MFLVESSQELGPGDQQHWEPANLIVFSCPAPTATTQSGLKENNPSVGQCKPSPVRERMCGCSSFPTLLPAGKCCTAALECLCWGFSSWAHGKGLWQCPGHGHTPGAAPSSWQDFVTPGHCTGSGTVPSMAGAQPCS